MILDRIKQFIDAKGMSIAAFERSIGMANASFGKSLKNNGAIGTDKLENILSIYPEISPNWLLTGNGDMLLQKSPDDSSMSFLTDQQYIKTFNRIFEESIPLTDLTFDQMGEYCGIRKERMKAIYMRQAKMNDTEIGMIATKMGLSLPWVHKGLGEQFIHGKFDKETFMKEYNEYYNTTHATPATHPGEGIPLIPINAMAGVLTAEQTVLDYECERYVVPMFKGADFLIPVKGSSMYPKYSSGDIVACQRVPMGDLFFQWNKVYVIDTNQGALIKRIKPGSDKDHILIVSDNEKYDPFELPYSAIHGVALVVGVIRLE
ncbi:S24 family peptidase [Phocaeicola coprophilus]|uniref:S24 family peptidase n=1 Tax=Phocaeicola coprophilus TaxID=387090 RepID=UPI00242B7816|nr:S24 family peptidase [Phocaeicola coprophilus]